MIILGDLHGEAKVAHKLCQEHPAQTILQLGDLGIGFAPLDSFQFKPNFRFFRGNHDSPALSRNHLNYLSDYGEHVIDRKKVFVVAGADSIDKEKRIEGLTWWRDEELSYIESKACLDAWESSTAEILITHDCPQFICENYFLVYDRSMTRILINSIYDIRAPKQHYFGHWHRKFQITSKGTFFRCLDINESILI